MAKIKGYNPPVSEPIYDDADGRRHYFGEFIKMIIGDGSISPRNLEVDITGQSRRGERPTQQGAGTSNQVKYRKVFQDCSLLWDSLPLVCPDPVPDPPPTSKSSIWDAKLEHGVVCSYYDLFMRCCINFSLSHNGAMPVGDCFPCTPSDACSGVSIESTTNDMLINEKQALHVCDAVAGFDYFWKLMSGPGHLSFDDTQARELAVLIDEGTTELEKINITEAWIEANKSATTQVIINPISAVEHDAYLLEIDGMKFYFDSTGDPIIGAVMEWVYESEISPPLRKHLDAIQFVSEPHPRIETSVASYFDGFMSVWNDYETDAGTIAHEAGHGLALATWGGFSPGLGSDYRAAMDSGEPAVTEYGATSPWEDFAEAIYLYTVNPVEMLSIAPLRFAAIKALLSDDIFYGTSTVYFAPSSVSESCEEATIHLGSGDKVCDSLPILVCSCIADPSMAWDYGASAETIPRNNSVNVVISGLNTPFTWGVSGSGFSLDNIETTGLSNTLNANDTACGSATITVTGCDDVTVVGYVRCTAGHWSSWANGVKLSGLPDTKTIGVYCTIWMTKTEGKYKQDQIVGGAQTIEAGSLCSNCDCSTRLSPNCMNVYHHTTCFSWVCDDMRVDSGCASSAHASNTHCAEWCCAYRDTCLEESNGMCMCNWVLRYREWIC